MKPLIVKDDLFLASHAVVHQLMPKSTVLILSGFPCCVQHSPPTETDGPPGTMAIARAIAACGHTAIVVVDDCNKAVFEASMQDMEMRGSDDGGGTFGTIQLECLPPIKSIVPPPNEYARVYLDDDDDDDNNSDAQQRFDDLVQRCDMIIACERAGPARDGACYTMRGINMTERNLIAPLDQLVTTMRHRDTEAPDSAVSDTSNTASKGQDEDIEQQPSRPLQRRRLFLAIGDGGNELGMGKVIDRIIESEQIADGDKIGCVIAADHLIAASVSNWGGYALAASIALQMADADMQTSRMPVTAVKRDGGKTADETTATAEENKEQQAPTDIQTLAKTWIERCLPSEADEIALLNRCVAKGCRDGVSGKVEATVDGMPLERSLKCLRDIRDISLSVQPSSESLSVR